MASHRAYVQAEAGAPVAIQTVSTASSLVGQVLVDVLGTPILPYTDGVLSGEMFPLVHPLTPGIAAIGRIAAVGADNTHLQPGQPVFCNPAIRARDDRSGGTSILQGWFGGITPESMKLMQGPWRQGSWSEKLMVPTQNTVVLDERRLIQGLGYTIPQLCRINEFLVPFGGLLAANFRPGLTIIVAPGTGHFGGCAVRVALAAGARQVIAARRNSDVLHKLEQSDSNGRVTGITLSVDVEEDAMALKSASPNGKGADVYLDFFPFNASNATHPQAPQACISAFKHGRQGILLGGVRNNVSFQLCAADDQKYHGQRQLHVDNYGYHRGGVLSLGGLNTKTFGFGMLQDAI